MKLVKHFLILIALTVIAMFAFPLYTCKAKRNIRTENIANLRVIALTIKEYLSKYDNQLPDELSKVLEKMGPSRIPFRDKNGQFHDWIFRPRTDLKHAARTPLIISPEADDARQPRSRLVLWSDFAVSVEDQDVERIVSGGCS